MQKIIGGRLTESIKSEQWVEIHLKRGSCAIIVLIVFLEHLSV